MFGLLLIFHRHFTNMNKQSKHCKDLTILNKAMTGKQLTHNQFRQKANFSEENNCVMLFRKPFSW